MYQLNPENAKQADTAGGRIDTTGKYIGQFTLAENVTSTKGTKGIEFSFRSEDGQTADYLTIWTINSNNEELFGKKILDAIMTCLRIKEIKPKRMTAEKYDRNVRQRVSVEVDAFPDLMGKDIGLLLQREPYEASDGSIKHKMVIALPFEASTGFTASEILNKAKTPEVLNRRLLALKDRPMQARKNNDSQAESASDDFNDDIPF